MTVLAGIAFSTLLTGLVCYLLGRFQLGNIVRFFPHPVIGGFLAGSGWLLVVGSCRVMYETHSSLEHMGDFFSWDVVRAWVPGAIFGLFLYVVSRRARHYLTLPALIVLALVVFFSWLHFAHISVASARADGWMLEVKANQVFRPIQMSAYLGQADWGAIILQSGAFGAILLTAVISILLNTTALELAVDRDIDLNQELRAAGLTNLAGGLCGCMPNCQSLSLAKLASEMGAPSRLVGLFSALICAGLLWFGSNLLDYIPRFVLGGILLFHGIEFLVEWIWNAFFELAFEDYLLVQSILLIVTLFGYLFGVGAGILIATVFFVVKYSGIKIVKATLSGLTCHSSVDRWPPQKRVLQAHGEEIHILRLTGYIFFGSASNLLHRIRLRTLDPRLPRLRCLILDFKNVSGLDASALVSMRKLVRLALKEEFILAVSSITPDVEVHFRQEGLMLDQVSHLRLFPDCDRALEWCEDLILERESLRVQRLPGTLREILRDTYSWPVEIDPFFLYLERVDLEVGQRLISQGTLDSEIYFLESGRVNVVVELDHGRQMRVSTLEAGTVVGEIGLYLHRRRTASVIVEQKGTAYRLTAAQLKKMEAERPALAIAFHQFIIWTLADRMGNQMAALQALSE
jgi:SulP family sulfate permease